MLPEVRGRVKGRHRDGLLEVRRFDDKDAAHLFLDLDERTVGVVTSPDSPLWRIMPLLWFRRLS